MSNGQFIVTGASRGIGAAIATELDRRGLLVVCLSRTGVGTVGHSMACDMTDERAVHSVFGAIARRGPVAGLINNAGVHIPGPIASLQAADLERTLALNVTAIMVAAREVYPMLREGGGVIVNIGSLFDKLGVPDNLAYCASKAAVGAMTRCMAVEWAHEGIRVINVAPGYIKTDLNRDFLAREKVHAWMQQRIPVGGPGSAGEVAKLVGALCQDQISFLTGETIYVDGAQGINH